MSDHPSSSELRTGTLPARARVAIGIVVALAGLGLVLFKKLDPVAPNRSDELSSQSRLVPGVFHPTAEQWASLTVEPVAARPFRSDVVTDGKVAIDEDHATPIFSPYSGRVTRLAAKPGDEIERGQLLFALEATDMVQAENDFITANATLETVRSQLNLAQVNEKRQHELYDGKAVPLKDWQAAQNDLTAAQSNVRAAEIALEAVRNRLRILQKTQAEIDDFQATGKINPDTPIYSPIAGTVLLRKVGPGQFITSGASDPTGDPVFLIGDLAKVWLVAYVRESDTLKVRVGQAIAFKLAARPEQTFQGTIDYVAGSLDAGTRRMLVRATIDNPDKLLKPEMFASVTVYTSEPAMWPALPREAIIYEGDTARVWVAADDKTITLRNIKPGLVNGNLVQVLDGLQACESVVTKGGLFIDQAAAGGQT
jgi:cobalt-zinc-cadmium efflux system membrane fusion protein